MGEGGENIERKNEKEGTKEKGGTLGGALKKAN